MKSSCQPELGKVVVVCDHTTLGHLGGTWYLEVPWQYVTCLVTLCPRGTSEMCEVPCREACMKARTALCLEV